MKRKYSINSSIFGYQILPFSVDAGNKKGPYQKIRTISERGGFEPPDPGLPGQLLSREPDSASLAPLLELCGFPTRAINIVQYFTQSWQVVVL